MPIDTTTETLIPFHEAPKHIPGRPHISTLHRWRLSGRGPESFLRVGRRFTSLEAIARFLRHDEPIGSTSTAAASHGRQLERRAQAERELERRGI